MNEFEKQMWHDVLIDLLRRDQPIGGAIQAADKAIDAYRKKDKETPA